MLLYAVLKSVTTCPGTGASIAPLIVHPVFVIEAPVVPTSPLMVDVVQVTVPEVGMAFVARTAKSLASPRSGAVCAKANDGWQTSAAKPAAIKRVKYGAGPVMEYLPSLRFACGADRDILERRFVSVKFLCALCREHMICPLPRANEMSAFR